MGVANIWRHAHSLASTNAYHVNYYKSDTIRKLVQGNDNRLKHCVWKMSVSDVIN